jgi:DNA-directed RNA polymerase specialized sigma24 family protein
MEAVAATASRADEAGDARTHAGDREAFITLYGPHFEGVYDYVLRVVRERELAAEVVLATFEKGWRAFPEQGNDVAAWFFTTARACALDALRYRRDRNGDEREALNFTSVDGDRVPEASVVFDRELVELVWDTAAALPQDEYSLLALQARHNVPTDAIGEQLGQNGLLSKRLSRVRDAFDEQVTAELVLRRGRHRCTELEIVAADRDDRAVAHHIRSCVRCHEAKRSFVSPTDVLGALAWIEPTQSLRREIFGRARRRRVFGIL